MSAVVSYDDALAQLLSMFGETYDLNTIKLVLKHNRGHLESTVNDLLEGRIPRPRPTTQSHQQQSRSSQSQQNHSISFQSQYRNSQQPQPQPQPQPRQQAQPQQTQRRSMESMSNTPQQSKEELSTWDKLAAFFRGPAEPPRPSVRPADDKDDDDEDGYELVPTSKTETLTQRKKKRKDSDFDTEDDGSYYGGAIL